MTKRRQALCSREPLATSVFLSLILVLFFTLPCVLVRAEPASSGVSAATSEAQRVAPGDMNTGALLLQSDDGGLIEAPRLQTDVLMADPPASLKAPDTNQRFAILALVLAFLSAVTFIFWRYHRRDYASPRRIGRRI